ncbi:MULTISPECIES: phosphotransferase [unclassified Mycoplasma]|uniref:phosphotransferase n=1 Tax=unclassified Mycoplasma TaxID=2683645 RepID=UPI000FDD9055
MLRIKKLFTRLSQIKSEQILDYKLIHAGYTNDNYLFKLNSGQKYILRIPRRQNDFEQEKKLYELFGIGAGLYFSTTDGIVIRPWISGKHPDLGSESNLKKLLVVLKKVHQTKVDFPVLKQNWLAYLNVNDLPGPITELYQNVVRKITALQKLVLTHHDLNKHNILVNTRGQMLLLDWEWARLDDAYFDFASLALLPEVDQAKLVRLAGLDQKLLKLYQFAILVFSHMWCNFVSTSASLVLKQHLTKQIEFFAREIS